MGRIAVSITAICIAAGILVGCTFHQTPYIAYSDENRPLSDTAVFTALDKDRISESRITHVNGIPTVCWEVGCPYWVRVAPGTNTVTIKYIIPGLTIIKYANIDVTVQNMKPRHVYRALYASDGDMVSVRYEDLGENPDYFIPLYLDGQKFRAKF